MALQQWRDEPFTGAAAATGSFSGRFAAAVQAQATDARMHEFSMRIRDKSYAMQFEVGYGEGKWDGAFEALSEYLEGYRSTAASVLSFYASVYDPVLWTRGLQWWLTARGSTNHKLAEREIKARLDTYTWFRDAERVLPNLPKALESVLGALHEPGEAVGAFLIDGAAGFAGEFFESNGRPHEQGYTLGKVVGRGVAEICLLLLEILLVPAVVAGAMERVPRLVQAVRVAAGRLPRLPKRPPRAMELTKEALDDVERAAARRLAESTPPGVARETAARTGAGADLERFILAAAETRLPTELQGLTSESWAEVWEYARAHWKNVDTVKGILAEQLIEHNARFRSMMDRLAFGLRGDAHWDVDTLQYVRRARGKAPTRISAGTFQDLADGLIVVRARDPAARPQLMILAVFESKSPSNVGQLVTRGSEELGQIGWDFERISENPIEVVLRDRNGSDFRLVFEPDQVAVSRQRTAWIALTPKGVDLTRRDLERLKRSVPSLEQWNHPLMDHEIRRVAERLAKHVQAELPSPPRPRQVRKQP